jgi:hypothetical protein
MTRILTVVVLAFVFLLLPNAVPASDENTTLTIVVVDPERDRPVPRASVTLTFVSGRKMLVKKVRSEWNTRTNSKGMAEFPELPEGQVRLQVIAPGYRTHGEVFDISGPEVVRTIKMLRPRGQISAHQAEPIPLPTEQVEPELAQPEQKPQQERQEGQQEKGKPEKEDEKQPE